MTIYSIFMKPIKRRRKTSRKIWILLILIIIILGYFFISSVISFNKISFKNDPGYRGSYITWNDVNTINILLLYNDNINGNSLNTYNAILSIDPRGTVSVLNIPSNIKIITSSGTYQRLNTVYPIGNLNYPQMGVNLTLKYLRYSLAIPIEGYMSFNSTTIDTLKTGISMDSLYNFKYKGISIKAGYNNLSLQDIRDIMGIKNDTQLTLYIKNTIFDNILSKFINTLSIVNFGNSAKSLKNIFYSNVGEGSLNNIFYNIYKVGESNFKLFYLPNKGTNINLHNTDYYISTNFLDYSFSNSSVLIQILDASNSNGAVYQFSRYINNLGGNISSIGIYNGNTQKDIIYVSNKSKYSYDVSVLTQILGRRNVKIIYSTPNFFYTGSIIVVLGTDDTYIY